MGGKRRTKDGILDPYLEVDDFINRFVNTRDTFLDVCLAYNLFGFTEIWFRDFFTWRWDQLDWNAFNDNHYLQVLVGDYDEQGRVRSAR
jgi:hypothetical protein